MPIIQNVARKQGRIQRKVFSSAVTPHIFGPRGTAGANVGDVANPGNPSYLTAVGVDYNNRLSKTGGNMNPVGSHTNTATGLDYPALVPNATVDLVPPSKAQDVMPHEKGKFFQHINSKNDPMRVSGGVDPNANTPFHPKTVKPIRQQRFPQKAGERTHAISFGSSTHLVGNQGGATAQPAGTTRWGHIKRGAAEAPVLTHATLASPNAGVTVGSGTTGKTRTGGRLGRTSVIQNQHQGSPFVVAWVPQARGAQPNEKGNTNPVQQPCQRGCS